MKKLVLKIEQLNKKKEEKFLKQFYENWIAKFLFEATDLFFVLETVIVPNKVLREENKDLINDL